jgi:hypothetical protein
MISRASRTYPINLLSIFFTYCDRAGLLNGYLESIVVVLVHGCCLCKFKRVLFMLGADFFLIKMQLMAAYKRFECHINFELVLLGLHLRLIYQSLRTIRD